MILQVLAELTKGTAVPLQATKAYMGRGRPASLIFKLNTRSR